MIQDKASRGGYRTGAGSKRKYAEQTKIVSFRCPLSRVDEIKLFIRKVLKDSANIPVVTDIHSPQKKIKTKGCLCAKVNGLFRRADGCKFPAHDHNFNE